VVRSDAYRLTDDWTMRLAPERDGRPPHVDLDPDHFKLVAEFEERFAGGPPSLAACDRLEVVGDVKFGRDVTVRGSVRIEGPRRIDDGTVLEG
jgi:UTP--glucose-1-phosphate uridylyltransferase